MLYVTRSGKTSLICTTTEIHFLPVRERCTHALPRNIKYLTIDGQVRMLLQTAFCQTMRMHFSALGDINRTVWDTKLLSKANLAHPVYCIVSVHVTYSSEGTALPLSPNGCLSPPLASNPLPPPPTHLPTPIESIRDITGTEIACGIM